MKFFKRFWKSRRPNVVDKSETIIPLPPSTPTSEKFEQENSTTEETQSSLTSFEISQLSSLLTKFCTSAPSAQVSALLSKCSSTESDCTRNNGPLEDWAQNPVVLDEIFSHLGAQDLKLVRLVCKSWAHVAATPLAEKCVLKRTQLIPVQIYQLHVSNIQIFRSFLCFERTKLHNFGFKLRHVRLNLPTQFQQPVYRSNYNTLKNESWILDLRDFVSCVSFEHVRSLELCGLDHDFSFNLLLRHWLPIYGKKLKTLKLVDITRKNSGCCFFQEQNNPPPQVQVELETFSVEFDPMDGHVDSSNYWNFIRNCSKLKHLSLKEGRNSLHTSTENRPRYQEIILQALEKTRLEALELQLSALQCLEEISTSDQEPFSHRLLRVNSQSLRTFSLKLFIEGPGLWDFPMLPLAPSVNLVKYSLESVTSLISIRFNNLKIAEVLPLLFQQQYTDGRRVEISFDGDFHLIVKSPRELLLNLTQLDTLYGGSGEISLVLPTVLQRMFPDINYVCCACQSPADSGLSVRTTLVEHLGKEGVFDISKVLKRGCVGRNDHHLAYLLYEYKTDFFRRDEATLNIFEPKIVRGAALNIEGWSDEDLKVMRGAAFVFGHVPENKMVEAWAKVRRNVCTATSMFEQLTPEVVKSGQGSYTFCRQFTSWVGESYGELCTRFQLDQVDQDY